MSKDASLRDAKIKNAVFLPSDTSLPGCKTRGFRTEFYYSDAPMLSLSLFA